MLVKKEAGISMIELMFGVSILAIIGVMASRNLTQLGKHSAKTTVQANVKSELHQLTQLVKKYMKRSNSDDVGCNATKGKPCNSFKATSASDTLQVSTICGTPPSSWSQQLSTINFKAVAQCIKCSKNKIPMIRIKLNGATHTLPKSLNPTRTNNGAIAGEVCSKVIDATKQKKLISQYRIYYLKDLAPNPAGPPNSHLGVLEKKQTYVPNFNRADVEIIR